MDSAKPIVVICDEGNTVLSAEKFKAALEMLAEMNASFPLVVAGIADTPARELETLIKLKEPEMPNYSFTLFSTMFGNSPKSLNGNSNKNSTVAKDRRASKKARAMKARTSKRRRYV